MTTGSRSLDQRHYGLDWLRVGAFALLILYHLCMAFVTGEWLVKLDRIEWLAYPMLFLAPWRLGVLFIVSGYASRVLLAKLGGAEPFARQRTLRLIVPLLFAMALIVPPQIWVSLQVNHGYTGSYLHFLAHDAFRFGVYDGVTLPGWEHLWFVFYLWLYTMLLAAGAVLTPPRLRARLAAAFASLASGRRLLWLPLVYLVPVRAAITFTTGETHGLFNDWLSDAIYLPCFLFGFGLAGTGALWPAIARVWKPGLALALASYVVLVAVETAYPADAHPPHLVMALDRAALAAMLWGMALVMLRLADTMLNRDHRWRATLSEAVFPFYIIHQTIIVVGAWWLLPTGLPTALSFLILLVATVAGCWLFYRLGDALPALRPLIGLNPKPRYGRRGTAILRLRAG
ncbi:MAG TPA: acyltransferase family protein [Allosphingosinicella sp.]|nr:acyltransferase family protein [Allosphingosinicella sp.]